MSKYARILEIENEQVLVGLLNDKGLCGSGTCEGCSCSTKMQTMKVKIPGADKEDSNLRTGIDVEMIIPRGTALDWFLLIFLPVIITVSAVYLLQGQSESLRNITALASGILGFILSALVLKVLRKNQTIELIPVKKIIT
jgi:positive regulator of sigma E activity